MLVQSLSADGLLIQCIAQRLSEVQEPLVLAQVHQLDVFFGLCVAAYVRTLATRPGGQAALEVPHLLATNLPQEPQRKFLYEAPTVAITLLTSILHRSPIDVAHDVDSEGAAVRLRGHHILNLLEHDVVAFAFLRYPL